MNLSYLQMKTLADNYRTVSSTDVDIINYVDALENDTFVGGYADLAKSMGKDVANTRKSVLNLESMGILMLDRTTWTGERSRMLQCKLTPGWILTFLGDIHGEK